MMKSIVAYVRNLLGLVEDPSIRANFKRDRTEDDFSSDDDTPEYKKLKKLRKTSFPDIMTSNNLLRKKEEHSQNVRYVPIQIEAGHPSTSTPNKHGDRHESNAQKVPVKLIDLTENGTSSLSRKPRMHTPVRPVIHAVIEDDDENDDEIVFVETKKDRKPSRIYIEDDDTENRQDDDVVFVKKVKAPPPPKPYKFFLTKNDHCANDSQDDSVQYYRLCKKLNDRNINASPKAYSKFKSPPGITKVYKKAPQPMPRWLQTKKSNLLHTRNLVNGGSRTTLSEVFNLDEKKNYQELIKRVAETTSLTPARKPIEIINLAEDAASFRNTQKDQRKALNEIKMVEKGISADKQSEATNEYDPITVASINSSDSEIEIVPSEASTTSSVRIGRQNSLKDSLKDKPITGSDWLSKLDVKYKKKFQENLEKARDVRRECDIITKVNFEQRVAHLEHQLKHELSIPESLIEEVPPSLELPELTPEQEKIINKALGPGPMGQVLVEKFNLRITRQDLKTLSGLNWLNDEVINFYMNLLMQRCEEKKDLPKVYATNTFFYPKLMQSGQAGLRRWTRKVDIFAHNLIVVPVHLGVHWCLSIIDFRSKKINYLDSMGGRNQQCLDALLQYLRDEHKDKKGQPFDDSGWKTENLKDIPQQMNGSDCGMFACTFAEFSCRNALYSFSQQHMPYLRRKAALEILQGKLLL